MHTDQINHDPAITFALTEFPLAGRPSMGSWISYRLGSENKDLPTCRHGFFRDVSDQPLYYRLWGSGFLPSRHQGVKFHGGPTPCSSCRILPASIPGSAAVFWTIWQRSADALLAVVDRPSSIRPPSWALIWSLHIRNRTSSRTGSGERFVGRRLASRPSLWRRRPWRRCCRWGC